MENISLRIKELMNKERLNFRSFSKRLGYSDTAIANIVKGKSKPNFDTIDRIINKFPQINPKWLLTGKGPMLCFGEGEDERQNLLNSVRILGECRIAHQHKPPICTTYDGNTFFSTTRRIGLFLEEKNISVRALEMSIGASNGAIGRAINKGTDVHSMWISKIIENYPELNPEWLLTGKGPMLRSVGGEKGVKALQEPQTDPPTGISANSQKDIAYVTDSKEKDLVIIDGLKNEVQSLEVRLTDKNKQTEVLERQNEDLKTNFDRMLADKDKQIEDLKNNLGMVIASKDAMLAMKEEAIKGKNEIIRIQSKRICELEDNREAEDLKKILGTSERIGQESISLTDIHPKDLSTKAKKGEYKV